MSDTSEFSRSASFESSSSSDSPPPYVSFKDRGALDVPELVDRGSPSRSERMAARLVSIMDTFNSDMKEADKSMSQLPFPDSLDVSPSRSVTQVDEFDKMRAPALRIAIRALTQENSELRDALFLEQKKVSLLEKQTQRLAWEMTNYLEDSKPQSHFQSPAAVTMPIGGSKTVDDSTTDNGTWKISSLWTRSKAKTAKDSIVVVGVGNSSGDESASDERSPMVVRMQSAPPLSGSETRDRGWTYSGGFTTPKPMSTLTIIAKRHSEQLSLLPSVTPMTPPVHTHLDLEPKRKGKSEKISSSATPPPTRMDSAASGLSAAEPRTTAEASSSCLTIEVSPSPIREIPEMSMACSKSQPPPAIVDSSIGDKVKGLFRKWNVGGSKRTLATSSGSSITLTKSKSRERRKASRKRSRKGKGKDTMQAFKLTMSPSIDTFVQDMETEAAITKTDLRKDASALSADAFFKADIEDSFGPSADGEGQFLSTELSDGVIAMGSQSDLAKTESASSLRPPSPL